MYIKIKKILPKYIKIFKLRWPQYVEHNNENINHSKKFMNILIIYHYKLSMFLKKS